MRLAEARFLGLSAQGAVVITNDQELTVTHQQMRHFHALLLRLRLCPAQTPVRRLGLRSSSLCSRQAVASRWSL